MSFSIDPSVIPSLILFGVVNGTIIALLAIGLGLIFGVMGVANFAHGGFMILGAYLTYSITVLWLHNPYLSIPFSVAIVGLFGAFVQRYGFRRLIGGVEFSDLFFSFALLIVMQNAMSIIWSNTYVRVPSVFNFALELVFTRLSVDWAIGAGLGVLLNVLLYSFLKLTRTGRAIRAVSQNRVEAALMGVDVSRIDVVTFALGSMFAAVAGSLFGLITIFNPYLGEIPTFAAFSIILLGGIGNSKGTVIASLAYGLAGAFGAFFLGAEWSDAFVFAMLMAILALRPHGLFGSIVRLD